MLHLLLHCCCYFVSVSFLVKKAKLIILLFLALRMVSANWLKLRSSIKTAELCALTVTSWPFILVLKGSAIFWKMAVHSSQPSDQSGFSHISAPRTCHSSFQKLLKKLGFICYL